MRCPCGAKPHQSLDSDVLPSVFLERDALLQLHDVSELIVCGMHTEFCVDTTTRRAFDLISSEIGATLEPFGIGVHALSKTKPAGKKVTSKGKP